MRNSIGRKYHELSPENRVQFWNITASSIVAVLTFGFGMLIQFAINQNYAKETARLARYQMVKEVYPVFTSFIDTCGFVIYDFLDINEYEQSLSKTDRNDSVYIRLYNSYKDEKEEISTATTNAINILTKNNFYFDRDYQEKTNLNTAILQIGQRLLLNNASKLINLYSKQPNFDCDSFFCSLTQNITKLDPLASYDKDELRSRFNLFYEDISQRESIDNDTVLCISCALYHFMYKPFVDNILIYHQELEPEKIHWYDNPVLKAIIWFIIAIIIGFLAVIILLVRVFNSQNADKSNSTDAYEQLEQKYKVLSDKVLEQNAIITLQNETIHSYCNKEESIIDNNTATHPFQNQQ